MSVTNNLSFSFACFLSCKLTNDSPSLESRIGRDRLSWVAYLMEAWIGSVQVGTGGSIGSGGRMVVVVVWFSRAGSGGWRLVVGCTSFLHCLYFFIYWKLPKALILASIAADSHKKMKLLQRFTDIRDGTIVIYLQDILKGF